MLTAFTSRKVFERYLTRKEERQLFTTVAAHAGLYALRDHAWLRLLRQTGIRVGTLAALNVGDAEDALARRRLLLRDEICKGGHGYEIPLNGKACNALRDLLAVRRRMRLAMDPAAPLITSRKNARMSVRNFQDRTRAWRIAAGLPQAVSPHWLRHTLAKRVVETSEARNPLSIVQLLLGHASIESTATYVLPDKEALSAAAEAASW